MRICVIYESVTGNTRMLAEVIQKKYADTMPENRTLQERVRSLEEELSCVRLAEGLAGGGRNRERARARVNRLVREVDRCIALLNRQQE